MTMLFSCCACTVSFQLPPGEQCGSARWRLSHLPVCGERAHQTLQRPQLFPAGGTPTHSQHSQHLQHNYSQENMKRERVWLSHFHSDLNKEACSTAFFTFTAQQTFSIWTLASLNRFSRFSNFNTRATELNLEKKPYPLFSWKCVAFTFSVHLEVEHRSGWLHLPHRVVIMCHCSNLICDSGLVFEVFSEGVITNWVWFFLFLIYLADMGQSWGKYRTIAVTALYTFNWQVQVRFWLL